LSRLGAPLDAIDYVITHELCHIAVPHHGPEFFELLDRVLPDWRKRKQQIEQKIA
jgi:predicted metal-dependent hydrolase